VGIYGVLRIPGHPLDLSIGGRRRYPQDTAVSSGYHRYPLRIPSVSSQDTIGILSGYHRYPLRIPSVSSGYHRYPGVENTRYYPQDTAGILGIR
jgi:hypothetical protein